MPSKKKKYNARFPAGRIKKIMQSDEEIGKVAQAVPVIILELFVESLLTKTLKITNSRNAKTLSTSHMKQCIMSEQRFDFLRELVKNIPDISVAEEAANYNEDDGQSSPEENSPDSDTPYDLSMPSTSTRTNRTPTQANGGGGSSSTQSTHSQYKSQRSQSQNGGGSSNSGGDADSRQRLRQRLSAAATTSVIMHTATVTQTAATRSDYVQPLKLLRSESTPANAAQQCWQVAAQSPQTPAPPPLPAHRQRLRHQSQSMPGNHNNNNNSYSGTPAKRQKLEPPLPAIPAPIFSYDLCNKPIVKIDYSNLPLTHAPSAATVSAPAAVLPLSAPIINIDLSNIVANADSSKMGVAPAVATISIGAMPTAAAPTASSSAITAAFPPECATPPIQAVDSKVKAAAIKAATLPAALATSITTAAPAETPATTLSKNSNSFFELDEDYDNI